MSSSAPTTDPSAGQARSSSAKDSAAAAPPPTPQHGSRDSHCEYSDDAPTHEHRQDPADGNQEVHYYRGFLERLLDLVTHGDEQAVSRMISVIRSGASHDAILVTLAELTGESNQPDSEIGG
ncbi:hypothetical protein N7474_007222 [Penicillium riverlandense]|uniref:uncharacterized protein n=1 Tax=Penicillium riverlandense TaxID=1903569 RepID=UPI00254821C0|nr:uncharacterized protein N7474_007222 [Penicillium riverlandense]KAJ5815445.1 hypothetical protein N7474_007222 [Penicillium riverlandense]